LVEFDNAQALIYSTKQNYRFALSNREGWYSLMVVARTFQLYALRLFGVRAIAKSYSNPVSPTHCLTVRLSRGGLFCLVDAALSSSTHLFDYTRSKECPFSLGVRIFYIIILYFTRYIKYKS
jgi:hypothetical protein